MQKGVITGIAYWLGPREIIHSWVEVAHQGKWISLEGVILDTAYLHALQHQFPNSGDPFCGYAVATSHLSSPQVGWCGEDTYIQKDAIIRDLGVFDSPDNFFTQYGVNLSGLKALLYRHIFRRRINLKVISIRNTEPGPINSKIRNQTEC